MSEGTEVSVIDRGAEIEGIRKQGAELAQYNSDVKVLAGTIKGLTWGSVSGASMSKQMAYAMAVFCRVTKANPLIHLDVLGNKPYLNSAYYADLLNTHPLFHHFEQRDLSPSVEQALRNRADAHRKVAEGCSDSEKSQRIGKALDYEEQADDLALARAGWSPPPKVAVVIETTVVRFANAAPMEKIKAGEITDIEPWLIRIRECNWAGGKEKDPVGNSNPSLTARTRSLRRAAVKSFSAWTEGYEDQIEKAEQVIEAEYTVLSSEPRTAPVDPDAPVMLEVGSGEATVAQPQTVEELPEEPVFDVEDARKKLFATLRAAGIKDKDTRTAFCEKYDLPESTKDWGADEYDRVQTILVDPIRDEVIRRAGDSLGDMSLRILEKREPAWLSDWNALLAVLDADHSDDDGEQSEYEL